MKSQQSSKDIALTAIFASAVTTFVLGLPMEFITEAIVFPFAHETALGNTVMEFSGSHLIPFYDGIGTALGVEPYGQALDGLDIVSF